MKGIDTTTRKARRQFLSTMAASGAFFTTPGLFAEALHLTPSSTEGPFYPDKMPLDTDNDLLLINDGITPAVGKITHLTGKVVDTAGKPIRNAVVEIWQVDNNGVYLHSRSAGQDKKDTNFQGFGRFTTSSTGEYYFRTVRPNPYPGRTPHIHVAVNQNGKRLLTTQLYVAGEKQNERDFLYQRLGSKENKQACTTAFKPIKDSKIGELAAEFNIVLGGTPDENGRPAARPRSGR